MRSWGFPNMEKKMLAHFDLINSVEVGKYCFASVSVKIRMPGWNKSLIPMLFLYISLFVTRRYTFTYENARLHSDEFKLTLDII